ncbi:MAG: 8-oxo-dGTP diphosphatase [Candidatus Pacebacteria bacterium]|nr:8-oxo-dGTP diphosphatase [Candidatus Paceibacterota bacterium]
MQQLTLCLLLKNDEILLAMKKRGFGVGKWNGVGGKLKENESIEEAALREMNEEIGVTAQAADLEKIGFIKFFFNDKPEWNQQVHLFFCKKWQGEPQESEEMKPQWYKHSEIPFDKMWVDDKHWLPLALAGKKFEGEFYFKGEGNEFEKFELREI